MRLKTQHFPLKYTRIYIYIYIYMLYNSVIPINITLLECDTPSSRCQKKRNEAERCRYAVQS